MSILVILAAVGLVVGIVSRKGIDAPEPTVPTTEQKRADVARLARDLRTARSNQPAAKPDVGEPATNSLAHHPEPEERFVTRAPGEWRGMFVNEVWTWPCSDEEPCSQARACVNGQCVACRDDSQCPSGESCVLDHCVRQQLAECRSFKDCQSRQAGALCVLSGTTHGTRRGNEDMRAYCLSPTGG